MDVGLNYRVYDADGKPIAVMSTHLGKVLDEGVGTGVQARDPLATSQASIVKARTAFGRGGEVTLYLAQDPTAARTLGAAATQEWNRGGNFPGRAGASVFYRDQTSVRGASDSGGIQGMGGLYLQAEQHARVEGKPTERTTVQADAGAVVSALGVNSFGEQDYNNQAWRVVRNTGDLNGRVEATLTGTYQDDRSVAVVQTGARAEVVNSNAQTVGSYTLLPNHAFVRVSGQTQTGARSSLAGTAAVDASSALKELDHE